MEPHSTDTCLIQTPLFNGHFVCLIYFLANQPAQYGHWFIRTTDIFLMCPESQTLPIVNPALRFEQISMAKPIL